MGASAPPPLPPAQNLPTVLPVTMTNPARSTGGTTTTASSAVPEPDGSALLLGGPDRMGLALRRRSR